MNKFIIRIIPILFLLIGGVSAMQAEEMNTPPKSERRMKPPPEAITVCKGKSEGTTVQFTTTRGDTLKGVCKQFQGVLAAMPERGPEGSPRNIIINDL
ncbi:MAG: hypothetical protein WC373_06400 [Smithella sp.]|jgi:hypothetical protein